MKTKILLILSALLFCFFKQNDEYKSFKPGEIWKDNNGVAINAHGGGIIYYNKTYYWFGEHKIEGEAGNKAYVGVHCYSSKDLYNWKDEGIALHVIKNQPGYDIEEGCILERPKVIYNNRTNKFVMWFHLEFKGKGYGAARSGVAVSNNITGPYIYLHSLRSCPGSWPVNGKYLKDIPIDPILFTKELTGGSVPKHPDTLNIVKRDFETGQEQRDQTLFVDDDGKAYHIYSSEENSTLQIAELTDDYTNHSGKYTRTFIGRFMEAPAIFKSNGKYYLIASSCTGWDPNTARSAVALSITGLWTESGNPCTGSDSALTFHSQSTYILPVQGKKDAFIFMADRWNPENAIDGRYVWLPVIIKDNRIEIKWYNEWDLNYFDH
jgi:hypothetical protein